MPRTLKQAKTRKKNRVVRVRPQPKRIDRPTERPVKKVVFKKGQIAAKARAGLFAKGPRFRSILTRKGPARVADHGYRGGHLAVLERLPVNSDWVQAVLLVMYNGQPALGVQFLSGFRCVYTTTGLLDFRRMAKAASKGKFIWRALYHGVPGAGAPYKAF